MLRQMKLLTALGLCNLCGFNEARYGKDRAKRKRMLGMGIVYLLVILVFWAYLALAAGGLLYLGIGEIIPCSLYLLASLVILCFSFFKAANVIFQKETYEMLISLPVSRSSIVLSRFLTMYVTGFLLGLAVVFPGSVMYGIFLKPSLGFYAGTFLGTLFLPAIPLTLATALGSVIFAVSAGMRHKNLVSITLTIVFVVAVLGLSFGIGGNTAVIEDFDISSLRNLAVLMTGRVNGIYPPAAWFGKLVTEGNILCGILLVVVSVSLTAFLIWVLQKYFVQICGAVNATAAKNRFKMKSLTVSTVGKALWRRELKRYFASSVYVVNTIIGNILMTAFAVMLLFMETEKITEVLEFPTEMNLLPMIPFVFAMLGNLMPMTACSVSMEGKQWWLYQTLPVTKKQIFDAKLLAAFTVSSPFYIATELIALIALKPSVKEGICLVCIPLLYTIFLSLVGLTVNLKFPRFQWESEVQIVKQSVSTFVPMLITMLAVLVPIVFLVMLPDDQNMIIIVTAGILLIASVLLYRRVLCEASRA